MRNEFLGFRCHRKSPDGGKCPRSRLDGDSIQSGLLFDSRPIDFAVGSREAESCDFRNKEFENSVSRPPQTVGDPSSVFANATLFIIPSHFIQFNSFSKSAWNFILLSMYEIE
jgi:hypothetical protein